ncbi:hypothetical protein BDW22DRAFT_1344089 [Trametopsis cervina]|nr:hypothetical protein BDW22DRAFT_1344089 [Trametopsis cervina]
MLQHDVAANIPVNEALLMFAAGEANASPLEARVTEGVIRHVPGLEHEKRTSRGRPASLKSTFYKGSERVRSFGFQVTDVQLCSPVQRTEHKSSRTNAVRIRELGNLAGNECRDRRMTSSRTSPRSHTRWFHIPNGSRAANRQCRDVKFIVQAVVMQKSHFYWQHTPSLSPPGRCGYAAEGVSIVRQFRCTKRDDCMLVLSSRRELELRWTDAHCDACEEVVVQMLELISISRETCPKATCSRPNSWGGTTKTPGDAVVPAV